MNARLGADGSDSDRRFDRARFHDLQKMGRWAQWFHWRMFGRRKGLFACFDPAARECFLQLIPKEGLALEIGPFGQPVFAGEHVRYADALSTEDLRSIAAVNGMDPARCPPIHYVVTETPLEAIPERFATVFSSHCIEHQPDLVQHLQAVGELLEPGGSYFLIVPDKRYCFDHFRPTSTIADVIAAHAERRTTHDMRAFVMHEMLVTHNDPARHWAGDHGAPNLEIRPGRIEEVITASRAAASAARYVDAHAWQFTPEAFEEICTILYQGGRTSLRPVVVYPTLFNRLEFCAVLTR